MNKFDFIAEMLEKKSLNPSQKERVYKLIAKEIKEVKTNDSEILKRIEEIEKKINENGRKTVKQDKKINQSSRNVLAEESERYKSERIFKSKTAKTPIHKPQDTKNFLSLFNNSEGLKYLTHKFNGDKPDYNDFLETCKREFEEAKRNYPNAASKLIGRIDDFVFSTEPNWYIRKGAEKIFYKNGWSKPEFVEWYKSSVNHPALNSKWNNEMIIPFKETIEVRAGNLLGILTDQIKLAFGNDKDSFQFEIHEKEINTAEFYTDVDMFQQALFNIFSQIKYIAEINLKYRVIIDYLNETIGGGKFKNIIITHVNSMPTKKSTDPKFAKGDLKTLQNNLFGLCNYEIMAKFPDGYAKRILLTDNYKEYQDYVEPHKSIEINESEIKGFSHILKFY